MMLVQGPIVFIFLILSGSLYSTSGKVNPSTLHGPKTAYVTLIHGIDEDLKYRGFLLNTLIMQKALMNYGSKAQFVALIGFSTNAIREKILTELDSPSTTKIKMITDDLNLLKKFNVIIYFLPRFIDKSPDSKRISFAEMALLKIIPWSFKQYDRVQYFDADVMPTKNMDCYFKLDVNTFNTGNASPLNSGWYLAIPNDSDFKIMKSLAIRRLMNKWNTTMG